MATERKSYLHTPLSIEFDYQTVPERLEYLANNNNKDEIYVFLYPDGHRQSVSANELFEKSKALALSLGQLGITKGDVVGVCLPNDLNSLICTFGIICAGAIVFPVFMQTRDGSDVRAKIDRVGAKCLIISPGENQITLSGCMSFIDSVNDHGYVNSTQVPTLKFLVSTTQVEGSTLLSLSQLLKLNDHIRPLPSLDPDDTIVFFSTSGSTGESKFVPQSHHAAMIYGHHLKESIGYEENDVIYNERRLASIAGFPYMFLHDGVKVVTKTENLTEICEFTYRSIIKEKCTVACLFPASIIKIIDIVEKEKSSELFLKRIHTGGLPVDAVCMEAIGKFTDLVTNSYGSSECGFLASNHISNKADYANRCVGKPHSGVEMKIVDENERVVERGAIGTIHVRSPCLFQQYFNNDEKTKAVLLESRWMDTGDVGLITVNGKIVINGRQSERILQGGKHLVPSNIEGFIKTHPDVLDAIVIPIPNDVLNEVACACVLPKPGKKLTSMAIDRFCKEFAFDSSVESCCKERPSMIEVFEEFPKLYTGKPDKRALKNIVITRRSKLEL